jgi:hypothetical protein
MRRRRNKEEARCKRKEAGHFGIGQSGHLMKLIYTSRALGTLLCAMSAANAQTLANTWTVAGGGLDPAAYGGNYLPATLVADTGSTGNATIAMSGLTSGGLGSSSFPSGYGGIYTFFSTWLSLNLQVTDVLEDIDEVSVTFLAGGGNPTPVSYLQDSIALNYNLANPAVTSDDFSTISGIVVDSPIGPQNLTSYTWTWSDLSSMGASDAFSVAWGGQGQAHVFMTDISVSQAIPEPSVIGLLAIGAAALGWMHRRRR